MSQLVYEAFSVGVITVIFGNVTACILDFLVLAPRLKIKLPLATTKDNFYQMGIILFLTGVLAHLTLELTGVNKWYCKNGFASKR